MKINDLIQKICSHTSKCLELDNLVDELVEIINLSNDYTKHCIINDILDNIIPGQLEFILIDNIKPKLPILDVLMKNMEDILDNSDMVFDGKDIGQYVKHSDYIFKVIKRNDIYLFNSSNDKYEIDLCEVISKKELRQFKIKKIL